MKRVWQVFIPVILITSLLVTITPLAYSQMLISWGNNVKEKTGILTAQATSETEPESSPGNQQEQAVPKKEEEGYPVIFDGKELFRFSVSIAGISAEDRARRAEDEILEFAKDNSIAIDSLTVNKYQQLRVFLADSELLLSLEEADAKAAQVPLDKLADEYLQKIKDAITAYRNKRRLENLAKGALYALISTIVFVLSLKLLNYIYPKVYSFIDRRRSRIFYTFRLQTFQIISGDQQARIVLKSIKFIRWAIILVLLYLYIPAVLSFFPWTERLGKNVFSSLFKAISTTGNALINYVPNLFIIGITIFITYYTIRLCRPFFNALADGRISIPGFYQDWAQPTYKLTTFLIIAIAAAIVVPYLPGFDSPAFQGISVLIGALITFGGASTIANLIGGFIIIYTRAFQIGDRIKIDDYTGYVLEKTILSTRIRTPNNEIITIPNSSMIASSIINYTASLRDIKEPIILYTTITLGYDVPWRKVHQTLAEAALVTSGILQDPAPVVWQTSLDDFYISYQLRAYTNKPSKMGDIYSQLHQNIQDKCNEVDIEIMSPHYSAIRDGHQSTIPENYLPKDYKAPGFRVHPLENLADKPQAKNEWYRFRQYKEEE